MHIFLTGDIQVGKSTLIRKVLQNRPDLRLGGFRSMTVANIPDAVGGVYIFPADSSTHPEWNEADEANRIGIRYGTGKGAEGFPEIFETRGIDILRGAENCDLILMDEIGWMEGRTTEFRLRIEDLLEGDIPILGVVRQKWNTPLQEHIRSHEKVHVITVDIENRNTLVTVLTDWLDTELHRSDFQKKNN